MIHAFREHQVGGSKDIQAGRGPGVLALTRQAGLDQRLAGAHVGLAADAHQARAAVAGHAKDAARTVKLD